MITGRMAPSPTGMLHLGNALSFLLNWLYVRSHNGRMILRLDDIDPQRSKTQFSVAAMNDLAWLGLDWDGDMVIHQSQRHGRYQEALDKLKSAGLVYPCFCTRKDLRSMASAPQIGDMGTPYPGTCRNLDPGQIALKREQGKPACMRLRCPEYAPSFTDMIQGAQKFSSTDIGGDFALVRSDGVFAYQLATVVDDSDFGINFVLRGRDLLCSTPRQLLLFQLLQKPAPVFAHAPLLLDYEGERLAKRHQSLSLAELRKAGVTAPMIIGWLAWLAKVTPDYTPRAAAELLPKFDIDKLPKVDINLPPNPLESIAGCQKIF